MRDTYPPGINTKRLARDIVRQLRRTKKKKAKPPTLDEFFPRFMKDYVKANRQKPRGVEAKESIFRVHLSPRLGSLRLDRIREPDVQRLKSELSEWKAKTVNNVLAVLSKLLKTAAKWGVTDCAPVQMDPLKTEAPDMAFYEFDQYAKLVREATRINRDVLVIVLLGGDAGLRRNEIIALSPLDIDFRRSHIKVRHTDWRGALFPTKSHRPRLVPMTRALRAALLDVVDSKRKRVLIQPGGRALSIQAIRSRVAKAQRAAGLPGVGTLHILRHTFCSRLAMRGATALAIKELAGHRSMRTTLRYMHLSPSERKSAIALLDGRGSGIRETT